MNTKRYQEMTDAELLNVIQTDLDNPYCEVDMVMDELRERTTGRRERELELKIELAQANQIIARLKSERDAFMQAYKWLDPFHNEHACIQCQGDVDQKTLDDLNDLIYAIEGE